MNFLTQAAALPLFKERQVVDIDWKKSLYYKSIIGEIESEL